jgi:hypothetical protein
MKNNGYIEIDINGKKVGLKFNVFAMFEMRTIKGNAGNEFKNIAALIYSGIAGNAYDKQAEPELTFQQVNDWLTDHFFDGSLTDVMAQVNDAFINSESYQRATGRTNGEADEEAKKKIIAIAPV